MLICERDNFLEMIATERIPDHFPTPGDTRFEISVQSFGFAGQAWMWVDLQSLRSFVNQLQELEKQRQGEAELSSMSPGQFWLRIFSTDSLGHMALVGHLSGHLSRFKHELKFGFSFDPSALPSIVKDFQAIADGTLKQSYAE
ncbi:hypothetical protein IQ268_29915 [Oculatella sp. LEGE 06141]|uniref:WapI family immunity protein n=1 Tax=Oculatella sp. LEGE 06141 TaxID=1828648 RepID=UPI0018813EA9|nr:hypothetical protein [Oculatella sp. LEGE 06141]MBE9182755.1 hypothetical protein [Oculatella sp. LEGE 06141]